MQKKVLRLLGATQKNSGLTFYRFANNNYSGRSKAGFLYCFACLTSGIIPVLLKKGLTTQKLHKI